MLLIRETVFLKRTFRFVYLFMTLDNYSMAWQTWQKFQQWSVELSVFRMCDKASVWSTCPLIFHYQANKMLFVVQKAFSFWLYVFLWHMVFWTKPFIGWEYSVLEVGLVLLGFCLGFVLGVFGGFFLVFFLFLVKCKGTSADQLLRIRFNKGKRNPSITLDYGIWTIAGEAGRQAPKW